MKGLVDQEIFTPIRESLRSFSRRLVREKKKTLLFAKPTLEGALAIAPIEAALLDSNIPYRRRFTTSEPNSEPFIHITDNTDLKKTDLFGISLSTIIVEGLRGSHGDSRKGPLTTSAQAHALAMQINPRSYRLRRMRPWILSGNWINGALDTTYDPVYSFLRDYLSAEGSIRVAPITEVNNIHHENYPWINSNQIREASKKWQESDLRQREKIMESLVEPVLFSHSPPTSRVEELLWHCILGPGWKTDLASQISLSSSNWNDDMATVSASSLVDSLLSKGEI